MKRMDFYVQVVLMGTLVLSTFATFWELPLQGLRLVSMAVLGLWQPCSAVFTAMSNMGNLTATALKRYWVMVLLALSVFGCASLFRVHFQHLAYLFMGISAVYYLVFTQQFAFYKREKALW